MRIRLRQIGAGILLASLPTFLSAQAYQAGATGLQTSVTPGALGAVGTRSLPEYDPLGIQLGAWTLRPRLQAKTVYDDNIYNIENGPGDTHFMVSPSFSLQNSPGIFQLSLNGSATIDRFAKLKEEDADTYNIAASGTGTFGVGTTLGLTGAYGRDIEPRGTPGDTIIGGSPITYRLARGQFTATQALGNLHLSFLTSVLRYNYEDAHLDGTRISQSFRDLTVVSEAGSLSYSLNNAIGVFAAANFSQQNYDVTKDFDQNAKSASFIGGLQFSPDGIISGRIGAGYMHVSFADPRYPDSSGPTYNVSLQWSPTNLITATLTGSRALERSPAENVGGIVDSNLELKIDYELLRQLIISVSGTYDAAEYRGLRLTDTQIGGTLGAQYKLNRLISLSGAISGRRQRSNSELGRRYNGFSISGGIELHM